MPICQSDSWFYTFHLVIIEMLLQELLVKLTVTDEQLEKSMDQELIKNIFVIYFSVNTIWHHVSYWRQWDWKIMQYICIRVLWHQVLLVQWTASSLSQSCLESIAGVGCPGHSGRGWPTHASELVPVEHPPITKHTHTAIPLQAVPKTGGLAAHNPVHGILWIVNHREFPLNRDKKGYLEGTGLEVEELVLAEVQVSRKGGGKGRDGPIVGLVVQQHCEAQQIGPHPVEDP